MQFVDPAKTFAKDSIRLVKRCTKPDRKGNATEKFSASLLILYKPFVDYFLLSVNSSWMKMLSFNFQNFKRLQWQQLLDLQLWDLLDFLCD